MRLALIPLFTASVLIFYTGVLAAEANRENILGSWEGPLVIGRDNMTLAFTFTLKGEETVSYTHLTLPTTERV